MLNMRKFSEQPLNKRFSQIARSNTPIPMYPQSSAGSGVKTGRFNNLKKYKTKASIKTIQSSKYKSEDSGLGRKINVLKVSKSLDR